MKLTYYPDTDTLSIAFNDAPSVDSEEIAPDVVVDYDAGGQVVGMAIEMASTRVDLDIAETVGLPNVQVRPHTAA